MEVVNWPVSKLVERFMGGEIQLPEMQRRYVWTKEKVRALIDSLYKNYPSGSILLWETDAPPDTRRAAVSADEHTHVHRSHLLLDGQQRLTSLATVLTGSPVKIRTGRTVKDATIEIYFNMNHPDNLTDSDTVEENGDQYEDIEDDDEDANEHLVFQLKSPGISDNPNWISVTELFRDGITPILRNKIDPDHPNHEKYYKRLSDLYNCQNTYFYPVQILDRSSSYAEVADIFVRINSQGSKLRKSDLALAQVTCRWTGAMGLFSDLSTECHEKRYGLDEGFLIKCLVSVSTGQSRFKNINNTPVEQLKGDWENTRLALHFVIDFLKNNAKMDTNEILPVSFLIIPLVCLAVKKNRHFSSRMERDALRWFYAAMMWGRYSRGSAETVLDEDLAIIREHEHPIQHMMERIRLQSGRLEVKGEDLAGKTTKSPFFSMMYVLARRAGARDWDTGVVINIDSDREFRSKHRPVFSRRMLEDEFGKKYNRTRMRQMFTDISNTVFSNGRPAQANNGMLQDYLSGVVKEMGDGTLHDQCVPTDAPLWEVRQYEEFLAHRRELIVKAINDLMGSLRAEAPASLTDAEIIDRGETSNVEFKSSMLWDYNQNAKDTKLTQHVIRTIAAFLNSYGGTLYVGVQDDGKILGIERDYVCIERRQNWDGWSQVLANAIKKIGNEFGGSIAHEPIQINGRTLARITVKRSKKPAFVDPFGRAEFYIRVGTASQALNPKQASDYIRENFPA